MPCAQPLPSTKKADRRSRLQTQRRVAVPRKSSCRVHVAWSRREPMAAIEIACNSLVQHRRDMISACWRKLLILLASPAGLEPATCGLEIRCCYPTELRGRDGEAFTPRSPSSASAAKG